MEGVGNYRPLRGRGFQPTRSRPSRPCMGEVHYIAELDRGVTRSGRFALALVAQDIVTQGGVDSGLVALAVALEPF